LVSHLDCGCGKETLANELPQFTVHRYDSAIPDLDSPPEPHDLVICTNLLEHVEHEFVAMVIDDLARVTNKTLFVQGAISSNQQQQPRLVVPLRALAFLMRPC
jgi:hypothetical protein